MITVLQYLVIAAAVGLVVFLLAVVVFGRGEQMAPLPARTSPAELPENGIDPASVRALRFAVALRGYRMSDVDWSLEKVADEIEMLRAEVARLGGDPDRLPPLAREQLMDPDAPPTAQDSAAPSIDTPQEPAVPVAPSIGSDPDGAPTTTLRP